MATFTPSEVTSLSRIFSITSDYMSQHLSVRSGIITDADYTAIAADITAYEAIENDNVSIEPKEKNFGARLSASDKRSLIKNRIAGLIGWEMFSSGASLVRG